MPDLPVHLGRARAPPLRVGRVTPRPQGQQGIIYFHLVGYHSAGLILTCLVGHRRRSQEGIIRGQAKGWFLRLVRRCKVSFNCHINRLYDQHQGMIILWLNDTQSGLVPYVVNKLAPSAVFIVIPITITVANVLIAYGYCCPQALRYFLREAHQRAPTTWHRFCGGCQARRDRPQASPQACSRSCQEASC